MAGSIQRLVIGSKSFSGLKIAVEHCCNCKRSGALSFSSNSSSSNLGVASLASLGIINRQYSTNPFKDETLDSRTDKIDLNTLMTSGYLLNPSLYRLPFRTPPIINPKMIIDYKIPSKKPKSEIFEDPSSTSKIIEDAPTNDPTKGIEKQAARLIVIRRIKMNKHKLRKLRKKMKYVWAKVIQRREMRKEKAFLNELMEKIREAEKFDAKSYVANIIRKAKEKPPVEMWWKRNKLPDWLVKEKLAQKAQEEQQEYLSILDKREPPKYPVQVPKIRRRY